jgi:hypothetical protein
MTDKYDPAGHCQNYDENGHCSDDNCPALYCKFKGKKKQTFNHQPFNHQHPMSFTKQCMYFLSEKGCYNGTRCQFRHDSSDATKDGTAAAATASVPHSVPIKAPSSAPRLPMNPWGLPQFPPLTSPKGEQKRGDPQKAQTPLTPTYSTASPHPPPGIGSAVQVAAAASAALSPIPTPYPPFYTHQMTPQQQQQLLRQQGSPQFTGQSAAQLIPVHQLTPTTEMRGGGAYYVSTQPVPQQQQAPQQMSAQFCILCFKKVANNREILQTCSAHRVENCSLCLIDHIKQQTFHKMGSGASCMT